MGEDVETGGLMKFRYERGHQAKLSEYDKNEIRDAYAKAYERKVQERRNRIIFWIVGLIGLMVASGLIYYFLR